MSPSLNRIVLSFLVAVSCTFGGIEGAEAQRAASKAPAAKGAQPTNDTDRALDGAAKALDAGNADGAMSTLDGVLSGGGLSNQHMARALYLRGLANRKKGRPAQAISDLTSAVWLKDGLGENDRNAALAARGEISREVGAGGPAASDGSASGVSTRTRVASAPSSPPPGTSDSPSSSSGLGFFSGIGSLFSPSKSAPPPEAAPEPRRSAPPSGPATSSWQNSTTVDVNERRRTAERPRQDSVVTDVPSADVYSPPPRPAAPANRTAAAPQSSGGGLGSFFTGLFTGASPSSDSAPAQSDGDPQWRARDQRVAAVEPPPAPPKAAPGVSQKAAPSVSPKARSESKAGREASPITTSAIPSGAYRLQIATVRSRKDAEAVAARVRKEHVGAIGNRVLEVDETVFGGMGTFYRVRLGPYADVGEPQTLCNQLRPQGYDCLVVTN